MTHTPDLACSMVHSRRLPAAPRTVFAAFRDPELLARWWGPDGFRNRIVSFEFREGGSWRLEMIGPDGTVYPNHWHFRKLREAEYLLLEHEDESHHFLLEIRLEAQGPDTLVHWVQTFDTPEVKQSLEGFVGPANEQNLARWEAVVREALRTD